MIYVFDPKAAALEEILEELEPEDAELGKGPGPWRYVQEEASLGTYEEILSQLVAEDPTIVAWATNDPKWEFPGGYAAYTPTLGRFDADCDANGWPVFTARQISEVLRKGPNEWNRAFGIDWLDVFEMYRAHAEERVPVYIGGAPAVRAEMHWTDAFG